MVPAARAPDGRRATRERAVAAIAVGFAALAFYVRTMYPDVAGGDSGELIASSAAGGVAHPPGYPLYALLGRAFAEVPHGTLAWRYNLLSACCDAAAAAVLCVGVSRACGIVWSGIAAASLFAFAPGIWQYAISAEVFALNNLACAALVYCSIRFSERRRRGWIWIGAFVLGLGLSNHHTVLFTGVPLIGWALFSSRDDPKLAGTIAIGAACLAVGLAPYAYLWVASQTPAEVSWGSTGTWRGVLTHVLRAEYGSLQLAAPSLARDHAAHDAARAFALDVSAQLGWWGLLLAGFGVHAAIQRRTERRGLSLILVAPPIAAGATIILAGRFPSAEALQRAVLARFWQQPELHACVLAGYGLAALARAAPRPFAAIAGALVTVVPPLLRFTAMDHHEDRTVRSYGAEILRAAPPGAIVLTRGDLITNTVRYLQVAERLRTDVRVVDQELLGFRWERDRLIRLHPELAIPDGRYMPGAPDGFAIAAVLDPNVRRARVLVCGGHKPGDVSWMTRYAERPMGLCAKVEPQGEARGADDDEQWVEESEAALPRVEHAERRWPSGSWEAVAAHDHWIVRYARAVALIELAGRDPGRRAWIERAVLALEDVVANDPDPEAEILRTLAQALGRLGLQTADQRARAATAWRRYLRVAPSADPLLPAIREELVRLDGDAQSAH
jgi:hypothetical protein